MSKSWLPRMIPAIKKKKPNDLRATEHTDGSTAEARQGSIREQVLAVVSRVEALGREVNKLRRGFETTTMLTPEKRRAREESLVHLIRIQEGVRRPET